MNPERITNGANQLRTILSDAEKKTAELLGQTAGNTFVDFLRRRVSDFEIDIFGVQNIQDLQKKPYILVANHIKTKGLIIGQRDLNITPDAFIIERAVKDLTGKQPQIVASSDFGFTWHENPASKLVQRKVESWRDQVLTGAGFIPIKRGESRVNLKFFRQVRSTLATNTPIIIFPEGNSYWGHEQQIALKDGVAILAQKYSVPIVPTRIEGATTWNPKSTISVWFKEPILPNQSIEEIMNRVGCGIRSY